MGILLPPVSQVTNTRINLTQHHRNRSLDSALQRIPEVSIIIAVFLSLYFYLIKWNCKTYCTNHPPYSLIDRNKNKFFINSIKVS